MSVIRLRHSALSPKPEEPLIATEAAVSIEGLGKRFGTRVVLEQVDLRLDRGSFTAIVGRSGCGKSTLLRVVAGLETAEAGRLRFAGGEQRPRTRLMFQDARLLPWKSVVDNVSLGMPTVERGRATLALQDVGLADRERDWPASLSGGQRQRVALARALVQQPELLLLDEPLGALDALTRIEMQGLIERLWRDRGFTALLVTHDVQEAIALADRVVVIDQGTVRAAIEVDLPRPRARGSAGFAALEAQVLRMVLQA
jgi:sulfonate transport system ATP-binding protein